MKIKENILYITKEEKLLIEQVLLLSWAVPEVFLKNWYSTQLHEDYNINQCKDSIALFRKGNYKIIEDLAE